MASNCIDITDQSRMASMSLVGGVGVDADGEFTLSKVKQFSQEYATNVLRDAERNPLARLTNLYGNAIYDSSDFINGVFLRTDYVESALENYPGLSRRWDKGNLSNIEVADFLDQYNLTPNGLTTKANVNYNGLLRDLDAYYQASFSDSILGGFCKLVPQVFGAIDAFFDTLVAIDDAITKILSKLRNLDEALNQLAQKATIEFLMGEIKKLIKELIKKVFEEVMALIENFNIMDIIGDIQTFIREDIVKSIVEKRERACLLLNEDKQKKVEDEAEGLIDYIAGLFENPALEEIEFMIMRFCAYATNIEALIKDVNRPLDDYSNRYRKVVDRLKAISNLNTSTAVRNGGIRLSDERKKDIINSMEQKWDSAEGTNNPPPPTVKEYWGLPNCKAVKNGSDTRVKISGDWVDPEVLGLEGWVNVDLDAKVYLMRLQKKVGGQMNVLAGWRTEEYNKEIGESPESPHLTGIALDVEIAGDPDEWVKAAYESGFGYAKVQGKHIHLDLTSRPRPE